MRAPGRHAFGEGGHRAGRGAVLGPAAAAVGRGRLAGYGETMVDGRRVRRGLGITGLIKVSLIRYLFGLIKVS